MPAVKREWPKPTMATARGDILASSTGMLMTQRIPLLDLKAQYDPLRDEILATVNRVCDSQQYINGPEVEGLETELATMLDVRHAVAVSSGTDALLLALMTLNIGPGHEVITSTYSFFATAGAIARVGAKPVLVDIDPVTFNLDPSAVAAAITERTKAVIPVHLYGLSAEMDAILNEASRHGIAVIEDAAQAIGATYQGRPVGGFGAFGCFSFFQSKNLGPASSARTGCTRSTTMRSSAATSGVTRFRRRFSG
jgi:dTDP-4-amino-4,6-dideoxygalactose transaminase